VIVGGKAGNRKLSDGRIRFGKVCILKGLGCNEARSIDDIQRTGL
jgi:hypothetical protein